MAHDILIVDDSAVVRKATRRIIEQAGVDAGQIFEADNGQTALEILQEHHVDLVLADLNMPKMGGLELLHRMKADEATSSIPVVVVSSESSTSRINELRAGGITDYLHKPYTPEEFRHVILNIFGVLAND
jgi:two-component system chemotaxis response regulator CheY